MTFRLLDAYVGWDRAEPGPDALPELVALDDVAGVRLPRTGAAPDGPGRAELLPWFPDRRLAPDWYLLAGDRVLRRDGCGTGFTAIDLAGPELGEPVTVAARGHWLAVGGPDRLLVWWREGEQLTGVATGEPVARLAVGRDGTVVAAAQSGTELRAYSPDGCRRRGWVTGLPGRVEGLRIGRQAAVWILTAEQRSGDERLRIWEAERFGATPRERRLPDLAAALTASDLAAVADEPGGFCLRRPETLDADAGLECFDWNGRPMATPPVPPAGEFVAAGRLETTAIDSGLSRCRWHRVRVDADVPEGTTVQVSVAVTEEPGDAGRPVETDWQALPAGATDALVDQPPGRYLYLRLRLDSDGRDTPRVRRVRLDFPRETSAELLPAAFRDDPAADDFAERFLSLFDASIGEIDRVVERYPALLDGRSLPGEALPWLGGLLGLAFEAGWGDDVRRDLIAAAPELFRARGTPAGVARAVRIVFGADPVIHELAAERDWLRIGTDGRLGVAHLFGRASARLRVGAPLGRAPLRGQGDPYGDPLREHAYRLRVSVPAIPGRGPDLGALARLVRAQAPAHTAAEVHGGGAGWVVGVRSVVGVDTALVPLPPAVLSKGDTPVRLGRQSVLAASRKGERKGFAVGERATVGVTTVVW
ncbi:phage tail protein [Actinoplanes aureus]|uniref:Phage tail protein n=1 Tax=Actinoplanes aureus TaxID=2792083 RepID=A0A931CB50_9ACTN|nr:phage tail protein [Actinoplanes aureus]MBG0562863.1 phage tail protein [Actinoplanes aureus]